MKLKKNANSMCHHYIISGVFRWGIQTNWHTDKENIGQKRFTKMAFPKRIP